MRRFVTRKSYLCAKMLLSLVVALAPTAAKAQTNPVPYLYPLHPAAAVPGGPGFSLRVNGTGFVAGATVNWNGSPRPTTFVSNSQVTAAISAEDIAIAKTTVITVTNPAPRGGTSNPEYFQITFPYDAITFRDSIVTPAVSGLAHVGPFKVAVADFNGDGKPDLAELNLTPDAQGLYRWFFQILLGNGDGTFQAPIVVANLPAQNVDVLDFVAGDVNRDGKTDLIASYSAFLGSTFSAGDLVFLGKGDGSFQSPIIDSGSRTKYKVVLADVNEDGISDLVQSCDGGVCVALGNGDGTFQPDLLYSLPLGASAQILTVGDFHNSGHIDIVAAFSRLGFDANNKRDDVFFILMLQGNGDGTFGSASVIYEGATLLDLTASFFGPLFGLESLIAADFYNEGSLDLAFYSFSPDLSQPFVQAAVLSSMHGNGDGTFVAPLSVPGLPTSSQQQSALVAGDFNGDGHTDLAANNDVILIGNGSWPVSHSVVPTQSPVVAYVAADFNGDGRLDLVGIDDNQNLHVLLQTSVPDFSGSINDPAYQDVEPGETATYTIAVTSLNGFTGTIQFSATGLPRGATATFTPAALTGSGTVTVTITTARHTPRGGYPILVSGTSVGITHSGGITLNVGRNDEKFEDFGGTVSPAFQNVVPGAGATYQITIFPINGFDSDVRLKIRDVPPGATATFNPEIIRGGSGSSVLTIATPNLAPTGSYHLTIVGEGGGRRHENGMDLNIGPAGTDFTDFTGSITPSVETVRAGGVTSFTLSIEPIHGTGCIYLQVYGLPALTNGHFDRTTGICGAAASTVFTITTSSETPPGTYTLEFQGTSSGGFTHTRSATLIVTP